MPVKELKVGDSVESLTLRCASVQQGKVGKSGVTYQHMLLEDETGQIGFTVFGNDVNAIAEGDMVTIENGYVKEYPPGSGKLSLALSKDSGQFSVKKAEATPAPAAPAASRPTPEMPPEPPSYDETREERIIRQACLKAAARLAETPWEAMEIANMFLAWVMGTWQTSLGYRMVYDPDTRKRFWTWAQNEMGLSNDEVHIAAHVSSMKYFTGSSQDAARMIRDWIAEQQKQGEKSDEPSA